MKDNGNFSYFNKNGRLIDFGVGHINIRGETVNLGYDPQSWGKGFEPYAIFRHNYKDTDQYFHTAGLSIRPDWLELEACCMKVWGQPKIGRSEPSKIQSFLRLYLGRDVILTGIERAVTYNGYIYERWYYRDRT